MQLQEEMDTFHDDLVRATDHLIQHIKEEDIRDAEKAGQLMAKHMEKHNVVLESEQCDGDRENYVEVTEEKVLKAMKTGMKIHDIQIF